MVRAALVAVILVIGSASAGLAGEAAIIRDRFDNPVGSVEKVAPGQYVRKDLAGRVVARVFLNRDGTGVVADLRGTRIGTVRRDRRGDTVIFDRSGRLAARLEPGLFGEKTIRDREGRFSGSIVPRRPSKPREPGARGKNSQFGFDLGFGVEDVRRFSGRTGVEYLRAPDGRLIIQPSSPAPVAPLSPTTSDLYR